MCCTVQACCAVLMINVASSQIRADGQARALVSMTLMCLLTDTLYGPKKVHFVSAYVLHLTDRLKNCQYRHDALRCIGAAQ